MPLVPWMPSAANVLRSACTPAPPPLSEPAMVSATGKIFRLVIRAMISFWRGKLQQRPARLAHQNLRHAGLQVILELTDLAVAEPVVKFLCPVVEMGDASQNIRALA